MSVKIIKSLKNDFDTLILPVNKDGKFTLTNKALNDKINTYLKHHSFSPEKDKILNFEIELDDSFKQIILVSLDKLDIPKNRNTLFEAFSVVSRNSKNIFFLNSNLSFDESIITEIFKLGNYKFEKYISTNLSHKFNLFIINKNEIDISESLVLANAVITARDLINEPANVLYPKTLGDAAIKLGEEFNFEVEILDKKEIKKLKMECFLKVGEGSDKEPKLIVLRYNGNKKDKNKFGLIGKGVTFDSGGLSIKPSDSMIEMKSDMSGAAAVLGVFCAISKMKVKKNVVGVIAACENMINGSAYKLGDIIKSMNGKTVEIHNTDAEGRLTLADAVTYAIRKEKVNKIIDIATLTGACMVALGTDITGVVTNNKEMLNNLYLASEKTGEYIGELPNHDSYRRSLKSSYADLKNVGTRWGGAIIAGQFIEEFVEEVPWLHLDIAGPAFKETGSSYHGLGGTGAGTRLLYEFIKNYK